MPSCRMWMTQQGPFCNPAGVLMLPGIIAWQDDLLTALAKMTH